MRKPSDKDLKALELRMAGRSLEEIKAKVGFVSVSSARAGIARALRHHDLDTKDMQDADVRLLAVDRILGEAYKAAMVSGASKADRESYVNILEARSRLVAKRSTKAGLAAAFDRTVAACEKVDDGIDAALVESGRQIAKQIDEVLEGGTSVEVTRALYLLPHLKGILQEMMATPAAREALVSGVEEPAAQSELAKMRKQRDKLRAI